MTINGCTGRIFDYVKAAQLEKKWQERSDKTQTKQDDDLIKARNLENIKSKMKLGKRLSRDEMEYLRNHAPELYEKALKIEKEREEHRRALRNCKTKEEARKVQTAKNLQLHAEAKAIPNNKDGSGQEDLEFISMRMAAMSDEFAEFVKSDEYKEMSNEKQISLQKGDGKRKRSMINVSHETLDFSQKIHKNRELYT